MNREVFRKHENCGCTVEYDSVDGSKKWQDVWSKKWESEGNRKERIGKTEENDLKQTLTDRVHPQKDLDKITLGGKPINVESLAFDEQHINIERNHQISEKEVKKIIENALFSVSVWNGSYERYFSKNGAVYVNLQNNTIRTTYKTEEFTSRVREAVMEYEQFFK